jgi:hypothetical protein
MCAEDKRFHAVVTLLCSTKNVEVLLRVMLSVSEGVLFSWKVSRLRPLFLLVEQNVYEFEYAALME